MTKIIFIQFAFAALVEFLVYTLFFRKEIRANLHLALLLNGIMVPGAAYLIARVDMDFFIVFAIIWIIETFAINLYFDTDLKKSAGISLVANLISVFGFEYIAQYFNPSDFI